MKKWVINLLILSIKLALFLILIIYMLDNWPLSFKYSLFSNGKDAISFFLSVIIVWLVWIILSILEIKKFLDMENKENNTKSIMFISVVSVISIFLLFSEIYVILIVFIDLITAAIFWNSQIIYNLTLPILYMLPVCWIIFLWSMIIQWMFENLDNKNTATQKDIYIKSWMEKILILNFKKWRIAKIKLENLIKIAKLIIIKAWKNKFDWGELKKTYESVIKNYKSELSEDDYKKINTIIIDFIEEWWIIEFE